MAAGHRSYNLFRYSARHTTNTEIYALHNTRAMLYQYRTLAYHHNTWNTLLALSARVAHASTYRNSKHYVRDA